MDKHRAIAHMTHIRGKGKSVGQNARGICGQCGQMDKSVLSRHNSNYQYTYMYIIS
jgi:hypothetical protein